MKLEDIAQGDNKTVALDLMKLKELTRILSVDLMKI